MAYPNTFLRLTLHWLLQGDVADSSCSWNPSSPLVSLDVTTAAALSARADAFWAAIKDRYSSSTAYVGSSVHWIGAAGNTISTIDDAQAPVPGTVDAAPPPSEVAQVMSLRTAFAGRSFRGRMYLPGPAVTMLDAEGRYTDVTCQDIADAGADMLADVVVGLETFSSVVASATAAQMTPVEVVAVGNVADAQRRRRDAQIEVYATANI